MNGYLRNLMCFLFMLTIASQYAAAYTPDEAFEYTIANNQVTITKFTGSQTDVSIPPTIEDKPVVAIGQRAFYNNTSLTSVTIPSSVTSIMNYAFEYCSKLTSVTISEGVTSIGYHAFAYSGLTSVTIPSSVTSIGLYAFYMCSYLASVTISDGVGSIGAGAFHNCPRLTDITIPASVTSIGNNAFYWCSSLASISVAAGNDYYVSVDGILFNKSMTTLVCYPAKRQGTQYSTPVGVTTIADGAFCSCRLSSVTISEGVTTIGSYAFSTCSLLSTITLPASVTSIGDAIFHSCSSLASITVDVENTCYASVDGILFDNSQTTLLRYPQARPGTEYSIPTTVTTIGNGAFDYCKKLTTVTIPSSVRTIEESAFSSCTGLTVMTLPEGVTSIGNYAFGFCSSLTRMTISSTVTFIDYCAFYSCNSLKEIEFMGPPPTLGNNSYPTPITFYAPANMGWEEWTVPDGVTLVIQEDAPAQTIQLTAGWNWVGFTNLPESRKVSDVLGTTGFSLNDIIQTNSGMARFTGTSWMPGSFTVEYGKLYQIYVANDVEVVVGGEAEGPLTVPLVAGWNWIANSTLLESVTPAELIHNGDWSAGDRIQSPAGAVVHTGSKWVPATGFALESGKGYQVYTANEGTLSFGESEEDALYAVVDLSGGPNASRYPVRYTSTAPNLDDDTCRTTEMWLRKIEAGSFTMGAPSNEVGYNSNRDMTPHNVTLTQNFYIGVFECTQKQWELVMGSNPSLYTGDSRPVECVSYDMVRGTSATAGAGWPAYGHAVDATSFMGKLQKKTGLIFDLPTEAQWEYACRAGTTTSLNSGKNLTSTGQDVNLNELGRYNYDKTDGKGGYSEHTKVGSYLPNAFGLYDMHGNVWEWCLNWGQEAINTTSPETDPVGKPTGEHRVRRGGGWAAYARSCRSGTRDGVVPSYFEEWQGFRVACHPKQNLYAVVDLSGGPDAASYPVRYTETAPNLDNDTCRTTELWLRKVNPGTFTMGSPSNEVGYNSGLDITPHQVTLTQGFYIGVFECTQKQWELVMGSNPSLYTGDSRPVECVSYDMVRGTSATAGAGWPAYGHAVDATSFMGKLQAKTGLTFDLPTEAQWEYACRAGTTTSLNSGQNLTTTNGIDSSLIEIGRYNKDNTDGKGGYSQHTKVGSYLPNAWGLYDMHGNVWEWCVNWGREAIDSTSAETDPVGTQTGEYRARRGGGWSATARSCRAGSRDGAEPPTYANWLGVRIALLP